ncbi:MAG: M48 family metalloprotease [Acidimicrobiia bacterium]
MPECAMAAATDLFERRNRARIVAVVVIAAANYVLAVALAAVSVTLALVLLALVKFEIFPDSVETLEWFGYGLGGITVVAFVVGTITALFRIPFARRSLEHRVLNETGAVVVADDSHREVRNLLAGLAIAAGIPEPRFAVISDPAPNSFGVGTRPETAIVGVTTGLTDHLSRDELEAVLAYEVSRIRSWDVALSSWTVALTGGALTALDADGGALSSFIGWVPRHVAEWLQVWALRDQGHERDRAAVRFTRNPGSLVRALEKLDADRRQIGKVSRSTAPLWIEFPPKVLEGRSTRATRRLAASLLLDERIADLRELAHAAPDSGRA